jgi:hypothetical protein
MTSLVRILTGVSLIGGALAVGACGDDDSDGGSSTGGSASTTGGKAASGGAPSSGGVAPSGGKGGSTGGNTPAGGSGPTGGKAASGGSGGDAGGSDSGGSAGDGAGGDTGGFAGVPSEPEGPPLLERPVADGYDCELSQPFALFDLDWDGGDVAGGAAPWLFWSAPDTEAVVGAALNDGALGTPHTVHDPAAANYTAPPSVARNGERITLVWPQADDMGVQRPMLAQVDADGEVVTAAHALPGSVESGTLAITAAGDGYGLVWTERETETSSSLKFVRLDADSNPVGTPKVLAQEEWLYAVDLVGLDDGFGVAYGHGYGTNDTVRYLGFDADGDAYRDSVPFAYSDVALIRRGDRVLAAWTRGTGDPGESLAVTLRVGWFDDRGNPVGDTYDVQAAKVDEENVDPAWVEFGDDLGLAWSRGSVIYICAGCIPDNHVEFVVLDGDTLQRKSDVVSVENSETVGGLMGSRLSASGDDVTVVSSVTYHTNAEGASSIISCAR